MMMMITKLYSIKTNTFLYFLDMLQEQFLEFIFQIDHPNLFHFIANHFHNQT